MASGSIAENDGRKLLSEEDLSYAFTPSMHDDLLRDGRIAGNRDRESKQEQDRAERDKRDRSAERGNCSKTKVEAIRYGGGLRGVRRHLTGAAMHGKRRHPGGYRGDEQDEREYGGKNDALHIPSIAKPS